MMRRVVTGLVALALGAAACGSDEPPTEAGPAATVPGVEQPAPSITIRDDAPADVGEAEVATLVAGSNQLAIDLYRAVAPTAEANIALGPWSISEGLALPWVGARGDTAAEMAAVLHYDLPTETQHAAFATLRSVLRDRNGDGVSITTANRLFGQDGLDFLDQFLADQSRYYEAPLQTVDFAGDHEAARQQINAWTAAQTDDRIEELFPPGTIDPTTLLALVNAIHFEADWKYQFDPERTRLEPFTRADGSTVNVEMMRYDWWLPNAADPGWRAVRLPYVGDELSMVTIVPTGEMAELVDLLDAAFVAQLQARLVEEQGIHLRMPKFDISSHLSLIPPLRELGLAAPFDAADFSGITGATDLFIAAIEHEAFVTVDESGTEAGAATGTAMQSSHGPSVDLDRPFLFWIQDDATGALLFLGRVGDPDPTG